MHFEYRDHRDKLWTTLFAVLNFGLCLFLDTYYDYVSDSNHNVKSSVFYALESLAILVWLVSREPHDCFSCYNRIRHMSYSLYAGSMEDQRKESVSSSHTN